MRDIEIGRFGIRTFEVDRDGHLLPIGGGDRFDWQDGVCIAECKAGGLHLPPGDGCSCGIYSFDSLEDLRSQYSPAQHLVAVIAPEGQARIGANGTVSERARIVALWTADPRLTAMIRSATSDKIRPYTDLDGMVADYNLRHTTTAVADEPALAPRSAIRQAIGEVARSASGIGWSRFLQAILWAAVLGILVADTETDSPTTEPAAITVALLQALDRFVLVANEQVTILVVLQLVVCLAVSVSRFSIRLRRGPASSAVGRLVRHQLTVMLRKLIWPLVFVAAYCIFHGTLPASATIVWIGLFVLISSWTSGGALYHLTTSLTARMKRRQAPSPIRSGPTLRELIESSKRRSRQRRGIGPIE